MVDKVKVIGVPGRVAFTAPSKGRQVPLDKAIFVPHDRWITARLEAGDIKLADAAPPKAPTSVTSRVEPAPKVRVGVTDTNTGV